MKQEPLTVEVNLSNPQLALEKILIAEIDVAEQVSASKEKADKVIESAQSDLVKIKNHILADARAKRESLEQGAYDRDLGITGTSPVVDETAAAFEQNVQSIIYLADGEIQLARLMTEILKTTRRLKALEHIIIPRLESEYHYIRNALEERERSEHFSLKLAKRLLDRKNTSPKDRL